MKAKTKKRILIGAAAVILLLGVLAVFLISELRHYTDTNTWATVYLTGERETDTADAFSETHEYLKGDTISFGSTVLCITDISHDGTVQFTVQQGNLYTEDGMSVSEGKIEPDIRSDYRIDGGHMTLTVTGHRYR